MTASRDLDAIFDADRALRRAERALLKTGKKPLARLLADAVTEAKALQDPAEASLRLERLADLCAQVPGPLMADTLVAILDVDDDRVRVCAGEAIRDVGFERYAEIAYAIERAIERAEQFTALSELPFVLAEIGEPSAVPLMQEMAAAAKSAGRPEIVASVIEAFVELRDPECLPWLEEQRSDRTEVILEGFDNTRATLGVLATEALALLMGGADHEEEE